MIVVDVETTGLDPGKNSLVSIGAIDFSNPKNQFYVECRIDEDTEVSKQALEINGFSEEQLRDKTKKSLKDATLDFVAWLETCGDDRTLAGENPAFDRDFLKASLEKYGINWSPGHRTEDLHSLCYAHHMTLGLKPPVKNGRTDLDHDKTLNYVGLHAEPRPHNALVGAKMEAEAFSRLIYGKPLLDEFKEYAVPDYCRREK